MSNKEIALEPGYFEDEISGWGIGSDGKKYFSYVDNHHTTSQDLKLLEGWIKTLLDIFDNEVVGNSENDIRVCENKLGVTLPLALKLLYKHFGQDRLFLVNRLAKRNIILLEDLYVSDSRIVFKKQGKHLWGVDLHKDRVNHYDKEWYWLSGSMPLIQEILVSLCFNRLTNMHNVIYCRLKGFWSYPVKKATEDFKDYLTPLDRFELYGHMAFLNKGKKATGWLRSNCSMVDLLIGCDDLKYVEEFATVFNLNPKYKYKNDKKC